MDLGEGKKVLALPIKEPEYEEPVVQVKPVKKLKIKKPKVQPVVVEEYAAPAPAALPVATVLAPPVPLSGSYGGAAPVKPLLNSGYAPAPPPVAYPGHYRIDSQPKGKFSKLQVKQFSIII